MARLIEPQWGTRQDVKNAPDVRQVVTTPADARRVVRAALQTCGEAVVDDALLLTSEVVTNAMLHAGAVDTQLVIVLGDGTVRIEVDDPSSDRPCARHHDADVDFVPGGYGVSIVDTIARSWGVEPHDGDGKTVWFELVA